MPVLAFVAALATCALAIQSVSGEDTADSVMELDPWTSLDTPAFHFEDKRGLSRSNQVDMCACCASKQLSFCCNKCMKRSGLLQQTGGLSEAHSQALLQRIASRLNTACQCCEKTGDSGSRCCQLCAFVDESRKRRYADRR